MLESPYLSLVTMDIPIPHQLRASKTISPRSTALFCFHMSSIPVSPALETHVCVTMIGNFPLDLLSTNQVQGTLVSQTPGIRPHCTGWPQEPSASAALFKLTPLVLIILTLASESAERAAHSPGCQLHPEHLTSNGLPDKADNTSPSEVVSSCHRLVGRRGHLALGP